MVPGIQLTSEIELNTEQLPKAAKRKLTTASLALTGFPFILVVQSLAAKVTGPGRRPGPACCLASVTSCRAAPPSKQAK